jgi:hypothetical protein
MQICREKFELRAPRMPTAAGWFWIGYFTILGVLVFVG